jgi:hypothetical protein
VKLREVGQEALCDERVLPAMSMQLRAGVGDVHDPCSSPPILQQRLVSAKHERGGILRAVAAAGKSPCVASSEQWRDKEGKEGRQGAVAAVYDVLVVCF